VVSPLPCPVSGPLYRTRAFTRRKGGCARQSLPLVMPPYKGLTQPKDLATTFGWIRSCHNIWMDQIHPHWKIPSENKRSLPKMEEPSFQKQNFVLQPAPLKTKKVWGQVFPMLAGCH